MLVSRLPRGRRGYVPKVAAAVAVADLSIPAQAESGRLLAPGLQRTCDAN